MISINNIIESTLVPHTAFKEATRRIEQCYTYADGAEQSCIALVGESRTGKSRALEECYINHPRFRTSEGLEVPILSVTTPSKPTVKGLCELMLQLMEDPKFNTGTENTKTIRLRTLMCSAGTRMVMIDEFQHFYDKASHKVMHHVADWLKILVDDSRVALVVSGLPSCQAVMEQNEQLLGRFSPPIIMPRFEWRNDNHREEFVAILSAFYDALTEHFDLPMLDQPNMAFRCYCATGGLMGYLTKFLRQVVWNALDKGSKTISLEDLLIAHTQSVWTKEGPSVMGNPFFPLFNITPTNEFFANVQQIGSSVKEIIEPKKTTSRKGGQCLNIQSVLVGS